MSPLFLDTSYVIAVEAEDDRHHKEAFSHWQGLCSAETPDLVTTSFIFDEIVTFFNSRDLHGKAVETGTLLLSSPSVRFIHVNEALFFDGWHYLQRHQDKTYSLTDCISFLIMERFNISLALAFDRHFVQAGFRTPF